MSKKFWWNMVFTEKEESRPYVRTGNVYHGSASINLTAGNIESAKKSANFSKNAILLGCDFLGKMTEDEFIVGLNDGEVEL